MADTRRSGQASRLPLRSEVTGEQWQHPSQEVEEASSPPLTNPATSCPSQPRGAVLQLLVPWPCRHNIPLHGSLPPLPQGGTPGSVVQEASVPGHGRTPTEAPTNRGAEPMDQGCGPR
jgi:hypothetical protein